MNPRELFFRHLAQTSAAPVGLEITKAEGSFLFDKDGKEYIDLVGGISVANTGHRHPAVINALKRQMDDYLHVMVYGEFIESPQVQYAQLLTKHLPSSLNNVYFTSSGAEAVEGAMKLAKRSTGRMHFIAFEKAYHGSTQGALSLIGDEYWRNAFRPLLPGVQHLQYNSIEDLELINEQCAGVVVETVQGEAGICVPDMSWIKAVRKKCTETGALLILDEIQAGFGRSGKLWGFENFGFTPDILVLGKALGGGMPLGAFIADKKIMELLTENPVLGHITTFGGHPVSCAAGLASLHVLFEEQLIQSVKEKENLFRSLLVHDAIKDIRSFGLWMAVEFDSFEVNKRVIDQCIQNGVFVDWFLFNSSAMRISPPLNIPDQAIRDACHVIVAACSG